MKVLIILGGFFPAQTYGGPTVSIDNLCSLLCNDIDFYIVTSDHELNKQERLVNICDGWNQRSNCKVMYLRNADSKFSFYSQIVIDLQPDIIYINSLFSADKTIPFLRIAYNHKIPLLLAPRGELCINAFDKKYKKIPYIWLLHRYLQAKNIWYQSTSDEETSQITKILRVCPNRIFELSNVSSQIHSINGRNHKVKGKCRLVFISRIQGKKNLDYALNTLKLVKSKVQFDIYGPIEDEKYWDECQAIIKELPPNIQASYVRKLNHDEVGSVFAKYDGFLFPTQSENYGHVIVEAMSVGCPIITSDQVPWNDVNENRSGWSIPLDNPQLFANAVEIIANLDETEEIELSKRCQEYIANKTSHNLMHESYLKAFNYMVESSSKSS